MIDGINCQKGSLHVHFQKVFSSSKQEVEELVSVDIP